MPLDRKVQIDVANVAGRRWCWAIPKAYHPCGEQDERTKDQKTQWIDEHTEPVEDARPEKDDGKHGDRFRPVIAVCIGGPSNKGAQEVYCQQEYRAPAAETDAEAAGRYGQCCRYRGTCDQDPRGGEPCPSS